MHARVRERRPHLNEAQVEAAIVFKQVEEQCAEVAQQRRTMTAAALQRRALVSKKARAAEAALAHEDAVWKRAVDAQARREAEAKRRESEQLFMMIKAGSKLQLLPLYAHVGLILRGLRDDPPPPAPSRASDQRYTPEEAAKLVSAEEIHDGCAQLLEEEDAILKRFADLRHAREHGDALVQDRLVAIDGLRAGLRDLQAQASEVHVRRVADTPERDMAMEEHALDRRLLRARVRQDAVYKALSKRLAAAAAASEALLSMASAVGRAVSLAQDTRLVLLASKLEQAVQAARRCRAWEHPAVTLLHSLESSLGLDPSLVDAPMSDASVAASTPHGSKDVAAEARSSGVDEALAVGEASDEGDVLGEGERWRQLFEAFPAVVSLIHRQSTVEWTRLTMSAKTQDGPSRWLQVRPLRVTVRNGNGESAAVMTATVEYH